MDLMVVTIEGEGQHDLRMYFAIEGGRARVVTLGVFDIVWKHTMGIEEHGSIREFVSTFDDASFLKVLLECIECAVVLVQRRLPLFDHYRGIPVPFVVANTCFVTQTIMPRTVQPIVRASIDRRVADQDENAAPN